VISFYPLPYLVSSLNLETRYLVGSLNVHGPVWSCLQRNGYTSRTPFLSEKSTSIPHRWDYAEICLISSCKQPLLTSLSIRNAFLTHLENSFRPSCPVRIFGVLSPALLRCRTKQDFAYPRTPYFTDILPSTTTPIILLTSSTTRTRGWAGSFRGF